MRGDFPVIESMQSLGMDNFRVVFTRFLAFYSDNPSGLRLWRNACEMAKYGKFRHSPLDRNWMAAKTFNTIQ